MSPWLASTRRTKEGCPNVRMLESPVKLVSAHKADWCSNVIMLGGFNSDTERQARPPTMRVLKAITESRDHHQLMQQVAVILQTSALGLVGGVWGRGGGAGGQPPPAPPGQPDSSPRIYHLETRRFTHSMTQGLKDL